MFLSVETGWKTLEFQAIKICYIEPCKPNQNAYIERFNRTLRKLTGNHLTQQLKNCA
ncbi:integrase core domain-containing protein [Advenella sp. RU8]|uniref:integrase core domain-containing protein n=1 Tax=Advenella sp. RU8 TaxID=3399575 RepID=UPI003AAFEC6D